MRVRQNLASREKLHHGVGKRKTRSVDEHVGDELLQAVEHNAHRRERLSDHCEVRIAMQSRGFEAGTFWPPASRGL